jgi:mitochondrial-processing peptidase subunit beta
VQLEKEVENMGATLDAYTTREHTAYMARVFKKDVPVAVDILSDILQNAELSDAAIEREKSVILTEKETVEKVEEEVVFDHLHAAIYHGQPLGQTILGSNANIRAMKRQHLVDYIDTHYSADRMVLVGSGAVDHDELCALASKAFGKLPARSKFDVAAAEAPRYFGVLAKDEEDTKPLAYVAYAAEAVPWSHSDFFTFATLQHLLGSYDRTQGTGVNSMSRTCSTIAAQELAHSVQHFATCYHQTGFFGAYAVCPEEKLEDLSYALINSWPQTAHYASPADVQRAKSKLLATSLAALDSNYDIMEDIGRQVLTIGRRMSPAECYQRIQSVSHDDVVRVANEYLSDTEVSGAAFGRVSTLPDYNILRAWSTWWRL